MTKKKSESPRLDDDMSPDATHVRRLTSWEPPSYHDQPKCTCNLCARWRYAESKKGNIMPEPTWEDRK